MKKTLALVLVMALLCSAMLLAACNTIPDGGTTKPEGTNSTEGSNGFESSSKTPESSIPEESTTPEETSPIVDGKLNGKAPAEVYAAIKEAISKYTSFHYVLSQTQGGETMKSEVKQTATTYYMNAKLNDELMGEITFVDGIAYEREIDPEGDEKTKYTDYTLEEVIDEYSMFPVEMMLLNIPESYFAEIAFVEGEDGVISFTLELTGEQYAEIMGMNGNAGIEVVTFHVAFEADTTVRKIMLSAKLEERDGMTANMLTQTISLEYFAVGDVEEAKAPADADTYELYEETPPIVGTEIKDNVEKGEETK